MFEKFMPDAGRNAELEIAREQLNVQREGNMAASVTEDVIQMQDASARSDLTRWQQDLADELVNLQYDFERKCKNSKGEWAVQTEQIPIEVQEDGKTVVIFKHMEMKPIVNQYGIYPLLNLVKIYFTRNLIMSNLNQETIHRIMRGLVLDLVLHLGANKERYEIDFHDLKVVMRLIKDRVEPTLYRCFNNGERAYLNTVNKRIEAHNTGVPVGKKGIFGMFGGR